MGRWRYTLKFGEALRNAIDEEDYDAILSALVACFTELNKALPEDYDEYELENDLEDIAAIRENFEDGEDVEDDINYKLDELYDLGDGLRVWIGGI